MFPLEGRELLLTKEELEMEKAEEDSETNNVYEESTLKE